MSTTAEVIVQTCDELGAVDACAWYRGVVVDQPCRITVATHLTPKRRRLFGALCAELDALGVREHCGGPDSNIALPSCMATRAPGTRHLIVVPHDGAMSPTALERTVAGYLSQPGASATAVLPVSANASNLPPSLAMWQATFYDRDVRDATADLLAAAGVDAETRRVFVSYAHADTPNAISLVEALQAQRFDVFLDAHRIAPASLWQEVLRDAITDAAMVVVLETAASAGSRWVKREIGLALARRAGVVAVQPGPAHRFRAISARYVGPAATAGPFVAEQHRLLLMQQRAARVAAVVERCRDAGITVSNVGGNVLTPGHVVAVQPRPVSVRQLRRLTERARTDGRRASVYAPRPVLAFKRDDERWLLDIADVGGFGDGTLRRLVNRVAVP